MKRGEDTVEGIYAVYYSGKESYGAALIVAMGGRVCGADPLGAMLDGLYTKEGEGHKVKVRVKVPAGLQIVQGGTSQAAHEYSIEFGFRETPDEVPYIRVETPMGPINVRFKRLRGVDV